jgi:hypothetical protein
VPNENKKNDLYDEPTADEANGKWRHLVGYCLDRYDAIKESEYRQSKIASIQESIDAYAQQTDGKYKSKMGGWDIELPLTTISLDNIEPRLFAAVVGKKPYLRFELEQDQEQDPQTEIIQEWYNQELEDVVKIEGHTRDEIHIMLQEGTVYPIASYDIDDVERTDFVLQSDVQRLQEENPELLSQMAGMSGDVILDAEGQPLTQTIKDRVFDGVKCDIIPFHDIYIPDNINDSDWEQTDIIRMIRPTYAELLEDSRNKKGYMNIGPWLCDQASEEDLEAEDQTAHQKLDNVKMHGKAIIECLECYVDYIYQDIDEDKKDIKDHTSVRYVAQIALESKILIRLIPLREINFRNEHVIKRNRLFPERDKSYGSSIYEKLQHIQKGASKTFNMALNTVEITMMPWFFFTKKLGLKKYTGEELKLQIGKGIEVDDIKEGLYFPKFPVNPDQLFGWINLWVTFWERLLSIGDLQLGRQGEKDRTATETMAVIQEGNVKHNYQSASIKENFLSLLRTIYDLYYQNMPLNKQFLWQGTERPIPRAAMRRTFKFKLTGSNDFNNDMVKMRKQEQFYDKALTNPVFNPLKLAELFADTYGYDDTSELIQPDIRQIVDACIQTPQAKQLFFQAMQEAQQMAQKMEMVGKEQERQMKEQIKTMAKPPEEGI